MRKLKQINNFIEESKYLSWGILFLYVCLLCFVSYYHEPWHDEGQAWLIARDDSLWQLITVTTHYEGHPPLWHICLMPFAKMGISFEIGLKLVNIFFCTAAMWLLTIKSPLPWWLRLTLPFTYYLFYQYGVVNRVYSLLTFALVLAAYYYPQRKEKPYHEVLALAILSGTQAYGMILAFGIAMSWFYEIVKDVDCADRTIKGLWKLSEVKALCLLGVIAFAFGLMILPRKDTAFATMINRNNTFLSNFFYMWIQSPAAIMLTNQTQDLSRYKWIEYFMQNMHNYLAIQKSAPFAGTLIIAQYLFNYTYGLILHLGILCLGYVSRQKLLFFLPLLAYYTLASTVYWNYYHGGIIVGFIIFVLWVFCSDKENYDKLNYSLSKKFSSAREYKLVLAGMFMCLMVLLQANYAWTYRASVNDVNKPADFSREVAAFIKVNRLERSRIWCSWHYSKEDNNKFAVVGAGAMNCYFKENIFENGNDGATKKSYHEYKLLEADTLNENLGKLGEPDFIYGSAPLYRIFPNHKRYIPIRRFYFYKIWKEQARKSSYIMFMREDLQSKYPAFKEIQISKEEDMDYEK